tara:strand:+ start:3326 stop:3796 length:471 start_codon:yes stop_codon:yes gene_type:complete
MTENYAFMKSGFNNINDEPLTKDMEANLYAMVYSFMEKAIINASTYVTHSGRSTIIKKDLELSLKLETFTFLSRPTFLEDIKKWREIIDKDEDTCDELEESLIVNKDTRNEDEDNMKSPCACQHCASINGIEALWDTWTPHNQIEYIIKNAVERNN